MTLLGILLIVFGLFKISFIDKLDRDSILASMDSSEDSETILNVVIGLFIIDALLSIIGGAYILVI